MNGATVRIYSRNYDGEKMITPNFKVREFACKDGTDTIIVSPELVNLLQNIRTHFGAPVTINSAYRTESHNKASKGATYSQHKYGMAADIMVRGVTPLAVAQYAETLLGSKGGIGVYDTFTHVDVRQGRFRSDFRKGGNKSVSKF